MNNAQKIKEDIRRTRNDRQRQREDVMETNRRLDDILSYVRVIERSVVKSRALAGNRPIIEAELMKRHTHVLQSSVDDYLNHLLRISS